MKKPKKNAAFELRFYEGYKERETPRSVVLGNKEFIIEKILERKRTHNPKTGKIIEVFICEIGGQKVRIALHESGLFELDYL
jgi:Trm5-related predicted tRNA methylase